MKKHIGIIIVIVFSILLVSCGKDDSHLSDDIFEKYEEIFKANDYSLNKLIDATSNITGWFEITDKDVVSVYRVRTENGSLYMFLFPTTRNTKKWYDKILVHTANTDYSVYIDGHYVITTNDEELKSLVETVNN